MKQRSEKQSLSLTALPEYSKMLDRQACDDKPSLIRKRQLNMDIERSQSQIERSLKKRDNSLMAVHKSLAAVDDFYRTFSLDTVLPPGDT